MMKSFTIFILLCSLLLAVPSLAQRSRQITSNIKPAEINRMPVVMIDLLEKSYPKAHLQKLSNSSITVIKKTIHEHTLRPMYFSGEIALDQIESITLISGKRRLRTNLLGAAVGGAAGYLIGRQLRPAQLRQNNIELINQRPLNGFIEPILGGIIGLGIGTGVGDLFTPIQIHNVRGNPKKAISTLREYTPSRKSKKTRR